MQPTIGFKQLKEVCAIFLTWEKLSTRCSLLEKLKSTGLNEQLLKWIYSYLHGREQYVVLNGAQNLSYLEYPRDQPLGHCLSYFTLTMLRLSPWTVYSICWCILLQSLQAPQTMSPYNTLERYYTQCSKMQIHDYIKVEKTFCASSTHNCSWLTARKSSVLQIPRRYIFCHLNAMN